MCSSFYQNRGVGFPTNVEFSCLLYHKKKETRKEAVAHLVQFLKLISLQYLQCKGSMKMALPVCSLSTLMFLFGRFADPRSIETQTNPIDRSIALLLFHQPSDHAAGAVDDASSLKSPASVCCPPFPVVQNHLAS